MATDPSCPSREELFALGAGLLGDGDASRIGEHLDRCETCCVAMETMDEHDEIALALRRNVPESSLCSSSSSVSWMPPGNKRANDISVSSATSNSGTKTSVSMERYLQQLSDCGVMTVEAATDFWESLPPESRPVDGIGLANAFVQAGKLTTYQAEAILLNKGKSLVVGNYLVLEKLGQGGMGVVLKAIHRRLNRVVALKVLSPRFRARPESTQRFKREVQAAGKLSHPHIVKAVDAELEGSKPYLVMEYVAGCDLSTIVKQRGRLPLHSAVDLVLQAARGLEFAHSQGIIHRDVKPSNLMRDPSGIVKVLDLGLARMISSEIGLSNLTMTGTVMGTADYMAPEQAADTKQADGRADVYSLGITLWYLLTGRVAFEGGTTMSKLLAHREAPVPSLIEVREDVPADLERVFQKMAAKDPAHRHATMGELISDLKLCLLAIPPTAEDSQFFEAPINDRSSIASFGRSPILKGPDDKSGQPQSHVSTLSLRSLADENDTQPYEESFESQDSLTISSGSKPVASWFLSRRFLWSSTAAIAFIIAISAFGLIGKPNLLSAIGIDSLSAPTSKESQRNNGAKPLTRSSMQRSKVNSAAVAESKPTGEQTVQKPLSKTFEPPIENLDNAKSRLAILNRELESNPNSLGALNERTIWHKRIGNWREATADAERTADLLPGQSIIRFQGAYLGVLSSDLAAYRRTCQHLLKDFSNSDNVEDLERACKAMLFVPGEFELSDLPLQQFEKLIKLDVPDNGPMYWACVTRAFIACHENKPELALEWLTKREVNPSAVQIFTYSMLVRAQAEFKLGRTEEAIAAFEEAKSLMPADLIQKLDGTFDDKQLLASNNVHGDWLILGILLRQTQVMLDAQP